MNFFEQFILHYGLEGAALAGVVLLTLAVQLYYYVFRFGTIPNYRIIRRQERLKQVPPVSVVIPMFGENHAFLEDQLPRLVAQSGVDYELMIVYVGSDKDFYDDLRQRSHAFPHLLTTKIEYNPQYPITVKTALNVGIKGTHYDHVIFSTTDAYPATDRWVSLMAKGFTRGEVVLGYCGIEPGKGLGRYLMRMSRMLSSALWISSAIARRPYRGIRHAIGLVKSRYFEVNGFGHLDKTTGEDDLFVQQIATPDNTVAVLAPGALLYERCWGGWSWWFNMKRFYGSLTSFYPSAARNFIGWERGSRLLFFASVLCAWIFMPAEYKLAALGALLLRYFVAAIEVRRVARRLGERGMWLKFWIYDLYSIAESAIMGILLTRKDTRIWR